MHARKTKRGVLIAALVTLLSLAGASTASAVIPGGLVPTSCQTSGAVPGCVTAHDLSGSSNVIVSPDGRNVYVLSANALLGFRRDPSSGALTQIAGPTGCLRTTASADCRQVGFSTPTDIVITPDGSSVYVSNFGSSTILEFDRDAAGGLTPKTGSPCIANVGTVLNGCADARAMATPQRMVIDPAGRYLYVASSALDTVAAGVTGLTIGAGGALSQIENSGGLAGCVQQTNSDNCNDGRGLVGASALAISADGNFVYVAASGGRSMAVLIRNASTGQLAMSAAANGCIEDASNDGCTNLLPEFAASGNFGDLVVGAGGQVYLAVQGSTNSARVLTFDPSGEGLVRRAGAPGCISNGAAANCSTGRVLTTPLGLATTADGQDVYLAAGGANTTGGVLELDRSGDGSLSPRNDARGCIYPSAVALCTALSTLGTPAGIAVSPDGHNVYAVASNTGRLTVFKRDSNSPVCDNVTIDVTSGTVPTLNLPCSDEDGDALTYQVISPPTLGSLGLLDSTAGTVVYGAPQGQNGTTTFTVKASYTSFSTFEAIGSITVNVVGAPVLVPAGIDNDHDGFFAGQDCNDANAAIRPGAVEIKGNNIDENCDGMAEPFPTLTSGVVHNWAPISKRSTTFKLVGLSITQVLPKGLSVTLKCSGKKCPFKIKKLKLPKAKKNAINAFSAIAKKQRKFRAGQTLEVWVSAPDFNTKVARIALKKGKQPVIQPLCALPGQTKAQKSCS